MSDSPSAVLRATAAAIRERAQNATQGRRWGVNSHAHLMKGCRCLSCEDEPWAWEVDVIDGPACEDADGCCHVMHLRYADAEHIASWDPVVAAAVAGLLEQAGDVYDFCHERGYAEPRGDLYLAALEICRAYNRDGAAR